MELLRDYIVALTHLYGAVHKNVVTDIYNQQNETPITVSDVEKQMTDESEELAKRFVYPIKSYIVLQAIEMFDELDELLAKQRGKPRYIPSKSELMKYTNPYYLEKNKEYEELFSYLKTKVLDGNDHKAKMISEDIQGMIEVEAAFSTLIGTFDDHNVVFDSQKQAQEVADLVINLQNATRLWSNLGHTPKEIHQLMIHKQKTSKKKKIGRNDPCHCGSGKKYKKCCLDKDEKEQALIRKALS